MNKVFVLLLLCLTLHAQDLYEFSLYGGGGLSTLKYNSTKGKQSNGLDTQFGLNYTYFFASSLGIGTGLELAFYNAEYSLKNIKVKYMAKDKYGEKDEEFEFRSELNKYKETQSITMLQLPLMLQLQAGSKSKYYAAVGAKFGLPLTGNRKGSANVTNSGYYEEEDYEYKTQNFRGFGTFEGRKIEGKESFKLAILASMEMGMKWRLEDGLHLYTGAYFDYGLNNIAKKRNATNLPQLVEYNSDNPPNFKLNGMLHSKWVENTASQTFTDKVIPMAIGAKIKLAFGQHVDYFAKKQEAERLAIEEEKRKEEEKMQLELELARVTASERLLIEREAERLAAAERLLEEARMAHEKAQREQKVVAVSAYEATRLSAEKAQLEREVERMTEEQARIIVRPIEKPAEPAPAPVPEQQEQPPQAPAQVPTPPPPAPEQPAQPTQPTGEFAVQVAVVLDETRAQSIVDSLKQEGFSNAYYKKVSNPGKLTGIYYRVRIGYFNTIPEAESFAKTKLKSSPRDWWIDRTENDTKGHIGEIK